MPYCRRPFAFSLSFFLLALTGCVSAENEQLKGQLCEKWFNESVDQSQIVSQLGLYMPKAVDNGRAFNAQDIDYYCSKVQEN